MNKIIYACPLYKDVRVPDGYKEIAKIERQHLLILDDFGIQLFDGKSRQVLAKLIEDRDGKGALIIASQVPVSKWYDIIGEQTIADAILDRIVHNVHWLELNGKSMRKNGKMKMNLLTKFDTSTQ